GARAGGADRVAPRARVFDGAASSGFVADLLEVEAERDVAAVAEAPRALQRVVRVRAATLAREGPAPVMTAAVLLADVGEHEAVDALVRVVAHVVGRPDMGRIVPADV